MEIYGIIALVIVFIVLYCISIYNKLQSQIVLVDEGWSGIDVQLKKRFDLIPNLVETVKGYIKHEEGVFTKVTELRSSIVNSSSPQDLSKLEGEFRSTLKSLFAVTENYPELKADTNFINIQNSLNQIEGELESARRYYNGTVRDLNQMIVVFPNNILASQMKIEKREFFEITDESEKQNVKVSF